ncbi:VanZ family protein [Halorientalis salina]|uniref:VanZ family protein n=1 Tax=Halorientalis salina TaxID=2932266 RepID=UPI0010AD8717|nr:VanZ family protein [Halorientalis salina]
MADWYSLRNGSGRVVAVVLYAAVVFAASVAVPPEGGTAMTGPLGVVGADKWFHAVGYAVLVVLVANALGTTTRSRLALAVTLATGYGLGIEVVQSALPWRSFDVLDALANFLGALLAGIVLSLDISNRLD